VRRWIRKNWGVIDYIAFKKGVSHELVRMVLYGRRRNKRIRRALIRWGADFLKKHKRTVGQGPGDGNV
jgi:hypothetical protein